jgi:signal transduction histidine kinase
VCFQPERALFFHVHTGSTPVRLQGNFVRAILQTRDGSWWVGYHESGLQRFDATFGRELPVTDDRAFLGKSVYNLIESSDGSLYANTGDAILHLPRGGAHWTDVTPPSLKHTRINMLWQHPDGIYAGRGQRFVALTSPNTGNILSLPRNLTPEFLLTAILAMPSGASWYGYNDGLWQVHASGERMRTEVRYRINHILHQRDTIWVATPFGFGAVHADDGRMLAWYDDASGLPNNYVYGLIPDGFGHLWMGTNRGLVRYHIATGRFRWFSEYDGLQSFEFNTNAFARGRDGTLAFGGVNGISIFNPVHLADTAPSIRPVLATFLVNERTPDSLIPEDATEPMYLLHSQNNLTFEVRGLTTEPGNGLRIFIRLEGVDGEWVPHLPGTRARYSHLRPGTYRLWSMVAWPGTHGGTPYQLLTLRIAQPYWQTWWFLTLAVLASLALVAGIIMAVFRYRYHRRLAVLKQQQALAELRMQLARDIHDDIGAGLSRLSLMSDMAARKQDASVLDKVAIASRDMLARLGEIVWALRPQQGTWPELVADLRSFSGALFEDTPIHFNFKVEGDMPMKPVPPDIMHHLLMVWKEALRNALQHSRATEVSATLTFEAKHLRVVVVDNGTGMQGQPGRMRGKGLSNMHHRVEAMGGKLDISATGHSGTTIQFTIPV